MGIYDLPAEIDYVLNETQKLKMNYIGYSLGTLYYWILMSERPEYNKKINQMHALAPMAYWGSEDTKINIKVKLASYIVVRYDSIIYFIKYYSPSSHI
jgi:lysosomal acid lipase/cholesteryl ester hydrolase